MGFGFNIDPSDSEDHCIKYNHFIYWLTIFTLVLCKNPMFSPNIFLSVVCDAPFSFHGVEIWTRCDISVWNPKYCKRYVRVYDSLFFIIVHNQNILVLQGGNTNNILCKKQEIGVMCRQNKDRQYFQVLCTPYILIK